MTPPIKWPGGKEYLSKWIVSLAPPRVENPQAPAASDDGFVHFVETHAGGLAVAREFVEQLGELSVVVNDLNGDLTNFWSVLCDEKLFDRFERRCRGTMTGRPAFDKAQAFLRSASGRSGVSVERAWAFFVANRQSRGGAMEDFATLARTRTRAGMNELPSAWLGAIDGLREVHDLIKQFVVYNEDAVDVIATQDGPRTLYYLDPPYLHSTRSSADYYAFEMSSKAHAILLAQLSGPGLCPLSYTRWLLLDGSEPWSRFKSAWEKPLAGRFLLSAYRSPLYDLFAESQVWARHEKKIANHMASGKTKKTMTEIVYANF